MPKSLPDCPRTGCDAANTLTADRVEPRGVRVCSCSCCGKTCRVNADGEIVHQDSVTDIRGNQMFEP